MLALGACRWVEVRKGFHMPITDDDTKQVGLFVDEYLQAGYTKPLMFAAAMGAQGQAKGGRAFSLAVAGVDDDDAAALALGFFVGFLGRGGFNFHGRLSS